ncbi:hypothetical protein AAFF_G00303380 [Aldrovandia affinis]|uniref:Uncharacterized protein n=1 Tax=Aldrovandia affinis TaxID=143900 RepID=A0AAD7R8P6_9TELE|nr:hypothetical protein AAFF_G00303380 [Aldrovandia affinis]
MELAKHMGGIPSSHVLQRKGRRELSVPPRGRAVPALEQRLRPRRVREKRSPAEWINGCDGAYRRSGSMAQTVPPAVVCMFSPSVGLPMEGEGQGLAVPQLVMLANVALTADAGGCDFGPEEKQMVELKTVGSGGYSDSEEEEESRA